ncbi:hypothetical protein ACFPRL_34605 [Pseudoclavibacter helvolus]
MHDEALFPEHTLVVHARFVRDAGTVRRVLTFVMPRFGVACIVGSGGGPRVVVAELLLLARFQPVLGVDPRCVLHTFFAVRDRDRVFFPRRFIQGDEGTVPG